MTGCTGFMAGRNIQLKLAHAALDSGVNRYFPWQFGVDYDVIGRGSAQELVDAVLGRKLRRVEWSVPDLKDELAEDPDNPINLLDLILAGRCQKQSPDRTHCPWSMSP